ncbi:hypothetical protein RCC30_10655 [Pseudomonas fluorescens]|jgi:hypothetical protein|nr:hypothetical protein RCC30_10655 [Pseudomonas fluorescens]
MNKVSRFLTAIAFSLAGVAAHANAAVEQHSCHSGSCFQLTPVAQPGTAGLIAADGASRTPQSQMFAENGASRTPQSHWLESQSV